ncbi:MAG: rhodanese-like domain-containing protein [Bradymonadia bacterium]
MKNLLIFALLMLPCAAEAMTVDELRALQEEHARVIVIDVRSPYMFSQGHIPGALNIPAGELAEKRLPQLGQVVVYGDGIHVDAVDQAVTALNNKEGIQAEALVGGFPTWEGRNGITTHAAGMESHHAKTLDYKQLKALSTDRPVILVDLRKHRTNLRRHFPQGRMQYTLPRRVDDSGEILYVIIDDGDGRAEKAARKLKAMGTPRVAILSGGAHAIRSEGRPQRKIIRPRGEQQ